MGVFLSPLKGGKRALCLPHARGGVSYQTASITSSALVFPTHVGVFLNMEERNRWIESLPHARGGVSSLSRRRPKCQQSSPRTWGCFQGCVFNGLREIVFPTHVGVFLQPSDIPCESRGLPHARGGVSHRNSQVNRRPLSSPRTWGCFCRRGGFHRRHGVFPTHVGVFLMMES